MKVWQCSVCKYIHRGETPPEKCPVCGVDASKFVEITEVDTSEKRQKKIETTEKPDKSPPDPEKNQPKAPQTMVERIHALLLAHHAHPVSVHAPNGILPAAVILWILAWLFDADLLSKTAFVNVICVVIAFPFVIYTGILEWKKKYNGALTMIFKIKILAATVTTASCVISLLWYVIDPQVISSSKAWAFLFINIIMLSAAGVAGLIGGRLVFKD